MAKANIEALEKKYNDLLDKRDRVREELLEAKRALDTALETVRLQEKLDSIGLGGIDAEAVLPTLRQNTKAVDMEATN